MLVSEIKKSDVLNAVVETTKLPQNNQQAIQLLEEMQQTSNEMSQAVKNYQTDPSNANYDALMTLSNDLMNEGMKLTNLPVGDPTIHTAEVDIYNTDSHIFDLVNANVNLIPAALDTLNDQIQTLLAKLKG